MKQALLLSFLAAITLISCLRPTECEILPNLNADEAQFNADVDSIDAFLERNEIEAIKDPNGIRIVINDMGSGDFPELCDVIFATYEGRLLDNNVVFDSVETPRSFLLSSLIVGWQIGIPKVRKGSSFTLYIPSVYGYGNNDIGDGLIPANSNLVFDIKIENRN